MYSLLFILFVALHFIVGNSRKCEIKKYNPKLPYCWSINATLSKICTFCNDECRRQIPCHNGGHCCIKECGTACSPPEVHGKLPEALECPRQENLKHRIGCPPLQVAEKCHECQDYCQKDKNCEHKICCPTLCGKRCHEVIIT